MQFVRDGNQVLCLRGPSAGSLEQLRDRAVARFDEKLDVVAPHVAAALSAAEQAELSEWLVRRSAHRTQGPMQSALAMLPALAELTADALRESDDVPEALRRELEDGIRSLSDALDDLETASATAGTTGLAQPHRLMTRQQVEDHLTRL